MSLYSLILALWILFVLILSVSFLAMMKKTHESFVDENLYQRNYIRQATDALTVSDLIAKRFDVAVTFNNNETVAFRKGADVQGSSLGFPRGGQGRGPVPIYAVFAKNYANKVTFQNVVGNVASVSTMVTGPIANGPQMNFGDHVIVDKYVPRWANVSKTVPVLYTYYDRRIATTTPSLPQRDNFGSLTSGSNVTNGDWFVFLDGYGTVSMYFFVHTTPPSVISFDIIVDDWVKTILYKYPAQDTDATVTANWTQIEATKANTETSNPRKVRVKLQEGFAYRLAIQIQDGPGVGGLKFVNKQWYSLLAPYVYFQNLTEDLNPATSIVDPKKISTTEFTAAYANALPLPALV